MKTTIMDVRIAGKYNTDRALLKAAKPIIEKDRRYKAVHIADSSRELVHFSMPGQEYMAAAQIIKKEKIS